MKTYTTAEASKILGLTKAQLTHYRQGTTGNAVILTSEDFYEVIENGRAKIYYYESALEKIQTRRANRYNKKASQN
jgi:hypothetical protein